MKRLDSLSGLRSRCFRTLFVAVSLVGVMVLLSSVIYGETVLFEEDFESYGEGTNLFGQDGWINEPNPPPIGSTAVTIIGTGIGLGSKLSNGMLDPGHTSPSICVNPFLGEPGPGKIYTLTHDAYAHASHSHNSSVTFHASDIGGSGSGWWIHNQGSHPVSWLFDARYLTGTSLESSDNLEYISGGYDKPVTMTAVLDVFNLEFYGIADFGSQVYETTHFSVLPERVANIDGVRLNQDYRTDCGGAEFDNIRVTEGPSVEIISVSVDHQGDPPVYQRGDLITYTIEFTIADAPPGATYDVKGLARARFGQKCQRTPPSTGLKQWAVGKNYGFEEGTHLMTIDYRPNNPTAHYKIPNCAKQDKHINVMYIIKLFEAGTTDLVTKDSYLEYDQFFIESSGSGNTCAACHL